MKYISLVLLCTTLVLAPACRRRTAGCVSPCSPCYTTAAPASCDSCTTTEPAVAAPTSFPLETITITPENRAVTQPAEYSQDLARDDEEAYDNQDYASMNAMEEDYIEEDEQASEPIK